MRRRVATAAILGVTALVLFAEQPAELSAEKLDAEVDRLMHEGKYSQAVPIAIKLLSICDKVMGTEHPATAIVLDKLGKSYDASGDYAKAEPTLQRAVEILDRTRGSNDRHTTNALNDLAELYRHLGSYAKAEAIYKRILDSDRTTNAAEDRNHAATMTNLASIYTSMGQYAKAERLFLDALAICEKAVEPNNVDVATVCNQLAHLYADSGDYRKAEPLYLRALKIDENALGPDHPNIAVILSGLGDLYKQTGDLFKAQSLFQRTVQINQKTLGGGHPTTAQALNNLAALYDEIGDFATARPLYERALKIRENALGENSPETATTVTNLAGLSCSTGDYKYAVALFERALAIYERAFGRIHPRVALALNNLAELLRTTGQFKEAEALYRRALEISEHALGEKHPQTAVICNNLGAIYSQSGRYSEAASLYRRAAKISEKAFDPDHIQTATALRNLAYAYLETGKRREATELALRVNSAEEKYLSGILSFTSERQRLAFQQAANPYSLPAKLDTTEMLAQTILRQKGIVLDSLIEDRLISAAAQTSEDRDVIAEIIVAKQRLMRASLTGGIELSEQTAMPGNGEQQSLSERVERMEAQLARKIRILGKARRSLTVTTEQVQNVLSQGQVLVEFIRYVNYEGKSKWAWNYGAIIIASNAKPQWIRLGNSADIENNIMRYKEYVRGGGDEAALTETLRSIYDHIWSPIEKVFHPDTSTVAISPDGELNFVSFATLLDPEKKFLGEKYSLRYLATGRDLLREFEPSSSRNAVIFANPDFEETTLPEHSTQTAAIAATPRTEMRDLQSISLAPLPGTGIEATAVEHLLKEANNSVKVFRGSDASKLELRRLQAPHILHIASHGFFLPEVEVGGEPDLLQLQIVPRPAAKPKVVNPMYRSGLALAGAQKTLRSWSRGEIPPIENDGILTAEEAGGLKLDGTWLVVLSGCDTGVGEARAGEGVLGLRRGFVQAGAQNLLITLWPIGDRTTVEIMHDFYETAEKTHNAAQALADVQRKWLVRLRDARGIRTAVKFAGPFIMSSQGHL